jgi:hypothetical protein
VLKTVSVDLDGAPGMGFYQICKIVLQIPRTESVRATVKMTADPADGSGIGINGFLGFALKLQGFQVLLVKPVESLLFLLVHGALLLQCVVRLQLWVAIEGVYLV